MNFPQIEYTTAFTILLFIICFILILFYRSMLVLKREKSRKIALITSKIDDEKNHALQIKNRMNEITFAQQSIDNDFFKIKAEILTIDFTIKEICKFI